MSNKALDGVKIVEWADFVAGPFCAKVLADLGAEVIKIESPDGGDSARRRGPFPGDIPDPERSGIFQYLNTSKLGMTLDLRSADDMAIFTRLIADADIFIEDRSPRAVQKVNLSFDTLQKINPRLVMTSITPFGQTGPYADYRCYPLNTFHSAVLGYLTPYASPTLDREPLKLGGMVGEYGGGITAALGTLAALYVQRATGEGQHVDVSKQEAMIDMARVYAVEYPNNGVSDNRMGRPNGAGAYLVPCRDGHVVLSAVLLHQWKGLVELMGNPEWALNPLYEVATERRDRFRSEIAPRVIQWARNRTKADLFHQGQALGCPIAPVASPEEVMTSEQLKARRFFISTTTRRKDVMTFPDAPYKFNRTPTEISHPAPLLGEHNSLIREGNGFTRQMSKRQKATVPRTIMHNPLEGIRVADFTWAWAGAHATDLLALLGAEVIKIESRGRLDHTRILSLSTGSHFSEVDQSPVFSDMNANKLGITIDLKHPRSIELAKEIIKRSDVVAQNMRPSVMDKLGLGYDVLKEINPEIIMLSSSAMGSTGPYRHYVGYAPSFAAVAGMSYLSGYPDGDPVVSRGEVDLFSAATAAFSVMAALVHRQATGEGQHIDFCSSEAVSLTLTEELMDYALNGRIRSRQGNIDQFMSPHNCYRCRGDDKWVVIAVGNEEEWQALCRAAGHPEWITDPRFVDVNKRHRHEIELDTLITAWTVNHTHYEIMQTLQNIGVAATPCFNSQELYEDPHTRARGCWVELDHPKVGKHIVAAPPWKLSRTPAENHRHGPLLGEHNDYVFGEILGLSAAEIEELIIEKTIY